MTAYNEGHILATQDMIRFGTLFAMDKLPMFSGDFAEGYAAAISGGRLDKAPNTMVD